MWSLNVLGGSLTGQITISQIIHQNQQDIRAIRQSLCLCGSCGKANPQAAVSIYLFIYLLFLISHYIISHTEGLIFIPFLCFSPASISNFTISGCFSA